MHMKQVLINRCVNLLKKGDEAQGIKGKAVFDIIAGTSIGAMNAAVLVSYVVENGTYEGSAQRLADFWEYLCADSMIESNPFFRSWWDYWHLITKDSAVTRGFFIHSIHGSNIVTSH